MDDKKRSGATDGPSAGHLTPAPVHGHNSLDFRRRGTPKVGDPEPVVSAGDPHDPARHDGFCCDDLS